MANILFFRRRSDACLVSYYTQMPFQLPTVCKYAAESAYSAI